MLRYALRRALWSVPTLLATSLFLFFVTTLAPDPAAPKSDEEAMNPATDPQIEEARRARFLDLPRFFNPDARDVRSRAADALRHVAASDARRDVGVRELRRLGGAALPYVLPELETLPPDERGRVAVALAPLAERMGLANAGDVGSAAAAALFWTRFWDDRSLDFTRTAVERTVARLISHPSDLREEDLVTLDTFALPDLMGALAATRDPLALARLTRLARHACERGPVIDPGSGAGDVRRAVADWKEWWFVHASDFESIDGAERAISVATETRYGKWLRRAASGELGLSVADGEPIADKLRSRAPMTILLCALAMLVSWGLAVPIGAIGAWGRGGRFDVTSSAVLFLGYATPTFVVAEGLRRAASALDLGGARIALAVAALAVASLATSSRWQRAAMLDVVRQDYVRTAHAKGVASWRVAVVHALRNALMPTVTLAGLHLPALLGGAFVVEEVFGIPGVGFETLRAIELHDAPWLMAVILATAVAVTIGLVVSDLAYGALDPRVRELLADRQGGTAR
ncbi:MAG TPA: ABC transporter permease [Polyangiaceae bacterium]|nr:ABC transporter permease [Polyangiaceae bacterium]